MIRWRRHTPRRCAGVSAPAGDDVREERGGDPMHTGLVVLIVSVLGLGPGLLETGTAGTTGPPVPGQQ
jgi:hypothetical protein